MKIIGLMQTIKTAHNIALVIWRGDKPAGRQVYSQLLVRCPASVYTDERPGNSINYEFLYL
jgi:hypothetical protein